jgi:uncharacterized protein
MRYMAKWLSASWAVVWRCGLFIILGAVLLAPAVVSVVQRLNAEQRAEPQWMLYFNAVNTLTILAAAWVMVRWVDRRPFVSLGFARDHLAPDLLLGTGIGAAWLLFSIAILWLGGWIAPQPVHGFSWAHLVWTAGALIFNTICQEVLTRSYIFQTIQSRTNAPVAILATAVLFSLFHAGAFRGAWLLPAFNVFIAGVLFGTAYWRTGNLWLPISIHFMWNFLLGPVLGLTVSGQNELGNWHRFNVHGPQLITGGSFGIEGGLVVTFTSIAVIAGLLRCNPACPGYGGGSHFSERANTDEDTHC